MSSNRICIFLTMILFIGFIFSTISQPCKTEQTLGCFTCPRCNNTNVEPITQVLGDAKNGVVKDNYLEIKEVNSMDEVVWSIEGCDDIRVCEEEKIGNITRSRCWMECDFGDYTKINVKQQK